ncbi:MAG: hypothetical protein FGM54_09045, partial [Chitinophagaceae bacterium]|nr:hypothetical protein [Chitinophagaceae bacterium]
MKQCILFISFILLGFFVQGQINPAQYTDGLNGYYIGSDTAYQLFNEIKSAQDEARLLNTYFPFNTTQVNNCYPAISFPDTLVPKPEVDFPFYIPWVNDSNYYRAQQLCFKLNNDTGYAFCYKNPSSITHPKIAFIIIPGSGINQATAIAIYNPGNYHNNTCAIAQNCLPYGDVYTYVRPNEDFASFWTTTPIGEFKKLNYLAQTSKTNLANKNWAANCYIQIIALTKYLQTKYDKVVVLGLSSGAWGVMFSSLQTEPDGALLASGYSISFNDQTYSSNFNQMQYDGMFSSHPIDSVRQTIRAQKTQFLFSYGANDIVTNMADENSNHTTENYFNSPTPPGNTTYFYNFTQHRFPCEIVDTFFTKIKKMPKAYMEPLNTCTSDSLILRLRFIGIAPFEGMLYRNNIPYQSIYSISDTFSLTIFDEGEFELKNLLDSNQVPGFKTKPFIYNKVTQLSPGAITQQYVCQTDSTLIQLPINGTPPFLITVLDTNSNSTQVNTYFNNNIQFYKKNGNYKIIAISDSNNCNWNIPIPFNVTNDSLDISFNSPVYWCDSNKHLLNIQTQGRSPWTIQYYKSGTLLNDLISDSNHTFIFENGQYLFSKISDFNNCVLSLNQYFNLNASPLQ